MFLTLDKAGSRKQYKRLQNGKQKRMNKGISHKDTRYIVHFA